MQKIVLASSSPYRADLLKKLGLPFTQASPNIDETAFDNEAPTELVTRLAKSKAIILAEHNPDSLIIGSDQVAVIDDRILGKPGDTEKAFEQLSIASGNKVTFITGIALYNSRTQSIQHSVEFYNVYFRELTAEQISFYIEKEQPFDCAGSFKSEGFGVSLFKRMEGDDPNTLIGLPLIKLIELLNLENIDVLQPNKPI